MKACQANRKAQGAKEPRTMQTIYALIVSICMVDGRCVDVSPEVYADLTACVIEASHQRAQGMRSYCEEMKEEPLEESIAKH